MVSGGSIVSSDENFLLTVYVNTDLHVILDV